MFSTDLLSIICSDEGWSKVLDVDVDVDVGAGAGYRGKHTDGFSYM